VPSLEKAWTKRFVHLVGNETDGWRHVVKISGIFKSILAFDLCLIPVLGRLSAVHCAGALAGRAWPRMELGLETFYR